jgi:hypothetical protein
MPVLERRPFHPAELKVITSLSSGRGDLVNDLSGAGCVFMILFALGVGVIKIFGLREASWQPGIAVVAIVLAILVMMRMRRGRAGWTSSYKDDLRDGEAEVATFEVRDAIRVEEYEDEGSQYYLQLADGGVLFLGGQYLYEPEDDGTFPSTRIRTTRGAHSRILLDLECLGTPLATSAMRKPFDKEEHRAGVVPADGAILAVDFESLRPAPDRDPRSPD